MTVSMFIEFMLHRFMSTAPYVTNDTMKQVKLEVHCHVPHLILKYMLLLLYAGVPDTDHLHIRTKWNSTSPDSKLNAQNRHSIQNI